jgi:hypothetical protein
MGRQLLVSELRVERSPQGRCEARAGNRERARSWVNRRVGNGARGDRLPPGAIRVAARGGKASKGGNTSRGWRRKGCRKRDEPQGRKRAARCPRRAGGESRRGGGKPRGRNESGGWHLPAEGTGRRETGRAFREWTPARSRRRRGGSLDNPKRGCWRREPSTAGSACIGKDGAKVRRVCYTGRKLRAAPERRSSKAQVRRVASGSFGMPRVAPVAGTPRRAAEKAERSATSFRASPSLLRE